MLVRSAAEVPDPRVLNQIRHLSVWRRQGGRAQSRTLLLDPPPPVAP
jgi:hypothetical protein